VSANGLGYPIFKTLAICVPWSGRPLPPELPMSFKSCVPPMNTNTIFLETNDKTIAEARNFFCEEALKHGAKYVFMWDEDVLLPPHAVRELIYVMENYRDVAVVAGIYCLKCEHAQPMVFKGSGNGVYWDWKVGEVFEASGTGLGCSLVNTDALKDIPKPWFKTVDNMDAYLDNIPIGEAWSEDLYFAKKVKETGKWRWIAHGGLVLPHIDVKTGQRYELPPDSKPMRHLVLEVGKKKILDIGCGTSPAKTNEGQVVTVDMREEAHPDYRCDFRRLPFATGEFSIVNSSHSLEHVARNEVESTLAEWARVLAPDGELRLFVPNLEWACKRILEGKHPNDQAKGTDVSALDVFYGQQSYDLDFHKTGFTPKLLEELLRKLGFRYLLTETPVFHIHTRAWRKRPKDWEKFRLECKKHWREWNKQNKGRFAELPSQNGNASHAGA